MNFEVPKRKYYDRGFACKVCHEKFPRGKSFFHCFSCYHVTCVECHFKKDGDNHSFSNHKDVEGSTMTRYSGQPVQKSPYGSRFFASCDGCGAQNLVDWFNRDKTNFDYCSFCYEENAKTNNYTYISTFKIRNEKFGLKLQLKSDVKRIHVLGVPSSNYRNGTTCIRCDLKLGRGQTFFHCHKPECKGKIDLCIKCLYTEKHKHRLVGYTGIGVQKSPYGSRSFATCDNCGAMPLARWFNLKDTTYDLCVTCYRHFRIPNNDYVFITPRNIQDGKAVSTVKKMNEERSELKRENDILKKKMFELKQGEKGKNAPSLKDLSEVRKINDVEVLRDMKKQINTQIEKRISEIIDEKMDEVICKLCMERRINSVLQPCGHTMCYTCFEELKKISPSPKCPFDRKVIDSIQKLFI